MMETFELTNYNFYSNRTDMELITTIVDSLKEILEEDVLSVDKRWNYFSNKDNEVHHFDLCENCYDELIATFQIPIEIE